MKASTADIREAPGEPRPPSLVYIIGTYPSLTTTFIDREITALRELGAGVRVISVRRTTGALSPSQRALQKGVVYLLPAAKLSVAASHLRFALVKPAAYFGTLLYLVTRRHPSLKARLRTVAHFAAGVYAAHLLSGQRCDHVHAHFADRAATLALVASRLLGVPYSVTAHANDIYVSPVLLPEKIANARFATTCTRYNQEHLARLSGGVGGKVSLVYHGLDLSAFQPDAGARAGKPVILAVGQLKEKKGLGYLIRACRALKDRGHEFECEIVGEGPLRSELEALVRQLSLESTVRLSGALPHPEVVLKYQRAHVFALPCVVAGDGDRDGIPNVLLEAMAMGLPVVSTPVSGIPEVVEDGVNGFLVPPGDEVALADALARLLDDPAARRQLGERGRERVAAEFDAERNARRLLLQFAA